MKSGRGCFDLSVIIFIRIRYHKELLLIDRLTFGTKGNIRKGMVSLELMIWQVLSLFSIIVNAWDHNDVFFSITILSKRKA